MLIIGRVLIEIALTLTIIAGNSLAVSASDCDAFSLRLVHNENARLSNDPSFRKSQNLQSFGYIRPSPENGREYWVEKTSLLNASSVRDAVVKRARPLFTSAELQQMKRDPNAKDIAEQFEKKQGSGGDPQITIMFTDDGARDLERLTKDRVGRQIALLLDGQLLAAPTIIAPIKGGKATIAGSYTEDEASRIVERIRELAGCR